MYDANKLKDDLLALEAAVMNPTVAGLLRATAAVEADLADVVDLFGTAPLAGSMKASPNCDDCKAIIKRITAKCAAPTVAAADVGKLGDGTLLKALLENLPAILAFISAFL